LIVPLLVTAALKESVINADAAAVVNVDEFVSKSVFTLEPFTENVLPLVFRKEIESTDSAGMLLVLLVLFEPWNWSE
jgi:hypothetical protein